MPIIFSKTGLVTDGLVLSLDAANVKSYPGSGTTWTDLSGNGNNGTLTNGPTFNSANGGNIEFDGINDYAVVSNSSTINITGNTISFGGWFYPTISNNYQHMIVKSIGGSRQYGMWLGLSGRSYIFVNLNGVITQQEVLLSSPWTVNAWNHIMLVYNGTTMKIYLNANEVHSRSATGNISTVSSNLNIGGEPNELSIAFKGRIAAVQTYNIALSAAQVSQNFNATRRRFGV